MFQDGSEMLDDPVFCDHVLDVIQDTEESEVSSYVDSDATC